ncbi:MAG: hypothetical protein WCP01_02235, partial [Methylococcaceae bacterium]
SGNATTGPLLKYNGSEVTKGQFGNWTPSGVEASGAGYVVVFKDAVAKQLVEWHTDANGNYSSTDPIGVVGVNSPSALALESLFS